MDGIVLKVEDNKLEHVCTFPALGYVQVIDQIYIDQPSCSQNIDLVVRKELKMLLVLLLFYQLFRI